MKLSVWAGWLTALLLGTLLTLQLVKPTLDPVAAYCRGGAELLASMYGVTTDEAGLAFIDSLETDCVAYVEKQRAAGGKGSEYRGPLLP